MRKLEAETTLIEVDHILTITSDYSIIYLAFCFSVYFLSRYTFLFTSFHLRHIISCFGSCPAKGEVLDVVDRVERCDQDMTLKSLD